MISIQFYLRCVLWLFLLYGLGSSVVTVVKGRLRRQLVKGQLTSGNAGVRLWKRMFLVLTGEQVIRGMSKLAFLVLGLVTGFGLGVGFRDHQLVLNMHTYQGVEVIGVNDPQHISVTIPGFDKIYRWSLCQPRKFEVGQIFDVTYEKDILSDCKSMSGRNSVWFHSKENIENAELDTR
jgi:hypothetical protein